ncbi:MAG: hydantoinase/oxoprolinase family protein [Candidatus Acetothermia bacterium]|jgi:N-methylhydantoinase A|nr:hydantoinase/oxoprolinase family protein [Candidatus Acetothermia bacterium]MDH7504801.1 hydantoinase/oxoprolinase family protein [Candidatus Acetothermia bacterium]
MLVGVDIGGTFTDIVALHSGELTVLKLPSRREQEEGVRAGLEALRSKLGPAKPERLVHGTTVATNALLEGKWARTALVTTAGFRDLLEIGRQDRPRIYDLQVERPRALVPRSLRFEVPERLDYRGAVVRPLDERALEELAGKLAAEGVEAVAIVFLFSYANPTHERRAGEILARQLGCPLSLSCEVLPEFREYERTVTTAVNAALQPVVGAYLRRLELVSPGWQIMQSNGGIGDTEEAGHYPVRIVLSGPAAGVEGARFVGELTGFRDLITLDMGGTSCDLSLVQRGQVAFTTTGRIAGYPLKVPMVDVHTIGAGGGSIAWLDRGGALRVGPESAGADPGPACYGRGGTEPTVTDAQVVLGRIDPRAPLGGLEELDQQAARKAIMARIGRPLGLGLEEAAEGILTVVEANMERAIRVISVERGHDPRAFVLTAFGGAGPLHGAALASRLGIKRVLVPALAGALSALGLLAADLVHDYVRTIARPLAEVELAELERVWQGLREQGRAALRREGVPDERIAYRPSLDLRYLGQAHELNIPLPQGTAGAELGPVEEEFHRAHERAFGHAAPGAPIELVNLRLRAIGRVERPELRPADQGELEAARRGSRPVHFPEPGWLKTAVFARELLPPGTSLAGPAVLAGRESTVLLPPGSRAEVDCLGNLIVAVGGS